MGCVATPRADLAAMELTESSEELRAIVEGINPTDPAKEEFPA